MAGKKIPLTVRFWNKVNKDGPITRHLFLGTKKDNARDAVAKGRWTQSGSNRKVLTEPQVREIRARYHLRTMGYERLGIEYGVSASAINHIVHRRTWADLK